MVALLLSMYCHLYSAALFTVQVAASSPVRAQLMSAFFNAGNGNLLVKEDVICSCGPATCQAWVLWCQQLFKGGLIQSNSVVW